MKNGLYSIHVSLQDGRSGKGSGVVMFRDGKILGGDAYLFYTGTYTAKGDTFKGEVLVQRHTSSPDANPLFGGPSPVGIGVSGTFTDTRGRHERHGAGRQGQPDLQGDVAQARRDRLELCQRSGPIRVANRPRQVGNRSRYSAACSSGATRGRMIWIRVPSPGSESRSSRPPRRLVTML